MKHVCILHINDGSLKVITYPVYLKLWFYHWHFMSSIGSVSTIIVTRFNSCHLHCLPEDGHTSGRNMWEVIISYIKTI